MKARNYLLTSAIIFGLVFLAHVLRIWNDTAIQIGTWSVPMSASWGALVITGILAVWAYLLLKKK